MPNPYEDLFDPDRPSDPSEEAEPQTPEPTEEDWTLEADDRFTEGAPEALDDILTSIEKFNDLAEPFSQLLTQTKAPAHEVGNRIVSLFLDVPDRHDQKSLSGERRYYQSLQEKFEQIIVPMRALAQLHLHAIQYFNRHIDEDYYSIEKTDRQVRFEKAQAIEGLNLQRKILAEATRHLQILSVGLQDTERRMRQYINTGGRNNISNSEYEMLVLRRTRRTSGLSHHFDYAIFDINLLDKAFLSLGIYQRETSAQYLGKLLRAFD